MSLLSQKLNAVKTAEKMYSVDGAKFQEWAINRIDFKGSAAHMIIGSLVTKINNSVVSVAQAEADFLSVLVK
jgi:hypothetical protein